ncbi:LysR family transcriptional regulator [Deltaproteobacteria bacterium]|nr:LysR family transcriptional regulator [Deltaproteobacteria bacterium]
MDAVEVRHLYYFAVVAAENNLRKAAERVYMAQPPLSRQIKQLEERLGVALFMRHSKGLTLTDDGAKVLEIIQPLLKMKDATFARLREEIHRGSQSLRIGFTTAFEQGVFARMETSLHEQYGNNVHIVRAASPKLVKDVRKGKLDTAFVALPLDAPGMTVQELAYVEPMVAALPEAWLGAENSSGKTVLLKKFNEKGLFWFKREVNPAFFDFTKSRFTQAGFSPHFIEEPAEHDVLLARIASGEGMGLFAASFAAIKREGVVFVELMEKDIFHLQLGIVCLPNRKDFVQLLLNSFSIWYG